MHAHAHARVHPCFWEIQGDRADMLPCLCVYVLCVRGGVVVVVCVCVCLCLCVCVLGVFGAIPSSCLLAVVCARGVVALGHLIGLQVSKTE